MLWSNLWHRLSGEAKLAEVAEETAAHLRPAVWDRVRRQIGSMGPAEARGYVRARSAVVVHREIDRLLRHDSSLRTAARARLIELTSAAVLALIADSTVFAATLPMPQIQAMKLRRAA